MKALGSGCWPLGLKKEESEAKKAGDYKEVGTGRQTFVLLTVHRLDGGGGWTNPGSPLHDSKQRNMNNEEKKAASSRRISG